MAKYNGRLVQVTRAASHPEDNFVVSSVELGSLTVPKSKIIFTEEEKAKFLKEDRENINKDLESSYRTQAMEDKRIEEEKAKELQNKYDEDRRRYELMSAEEKAAYDKITPVKPVSQPQPKVLVPQSPKV